MKTIRHYSGNRSRTFWLRIKAVEKRGRAAGFTDSGLYQIACALQSVEAAALNELELRERDMVLRRKAGE